MRYECIVLSLLPQLVIALIGMRGEPGDEATSNPASFFFSFPGPPLVGVRREPGDEATSNPASFFLVSRPSPCWGEGRAWG